MNKLLALWMAAALAFSLAACGGSASNSKSDSGSKESTAAETTEKNTTEDTTTGEPTTEEAAKRTAADADSWQWIKGELDCFGYGDCYMSYEVPDNFTTSSDSYSGFQYFGYYHDPSDSQATANTAPYGIYVYFNQGSFGAKRETLEADIDGGFTEREIGGRKVLFGKVGLDENTGSYAFSYYTSYSDDEYARIWFMVIDPEEDGTFRKTFEQSISFTKN